MEFSDKEIALDNIEMWMSEQETLHPIREVLDKAYDQGFKAGQESWKDKGIMEDVIEVAKKQARQDFAEELLEHETKHGWVAAVWIKEALAKKAGDEVI